MKSRVVNRILSLFLVLLLCLSLLPVSALAVTPTSAGWSFQEMTENQFRVYKHAAADSAAAERLEGDVIDLSDPLHFYISRSGTPYGGLALFRLEGPDDTAVPTEGCTITDEGFCQLRCSSASRIAGVYLTPPNVFPGDGAYDDGTLEVPGGMALQYYAGQNKLYYPAPGYYRFVFFERNSKTVSYSGVYQLTDGGGLYAGPGGMTANFSRAGGGAANRLLTDGTYDLRLSGFTAPDGTAVSAAAMTVKKIEFLTDAGSYIYRDGHSDDSVVSHPFNRAYAMYDTALSSSDGRALRTEGGDVLLEGFTATYLTEWGDGLTLASETLDYIYRVKLTAEVGGAEREFWCTAPISATYHDPSWTLAYDLTYKSNYPEGGNAADVTDQKLEGLGAVLRPAATFAAPEGWRFHGWNTAADGSGTACLPCQVLTEDTDLTLYAQWLHTSYVVVLPALDRVIGYVWLDGVYEEGGHDRTDQLWYARYEEPEDLSGAYLEVAAAEGRSYKRLELCAWIDSERTVIAAYDGPVDRQTLGRLSLTATGERWSVVTGLDVQPGSLRETEDYSLRDFRVNGISNGFPLLLSGDGDYRVRLNGVPASDAYSDYDWTLTYDGSLVYGSLLRVTPKKLERTARVTGTVTYRDNGVPVPYATVTASQSYAGMTRAITATADAEGRYTLRLFEGAYATLKAGDSYSAEHLTDPTGTIQKDLRMDNLKLFFTITPQCTETEGQTELARRYLSASKTRGNTIRFPDTDIKGFEVSGSKMGETYSQNLSGETYPEALTAVLSGRLFQGTTEQTVPVAGGRAEVSFSPKLNPGVVVKLTAERTGSYVMTWFDSEGNWIDDDYSSFGVAWSYDYGFVCPAEEKTGAFSLALLPTSVWSTNLRKPLADIDPENITCVWENVLLRDGEITELEPATISEVASQNAYYVTKPASTMRADRESFSHEAELVRVNGSIGLDKGLENGVLTGLTYSPMRGNCASFKALIINGETVPYSSVSFEETFFVFDEPIELPCDYTLLVTSERVDLDMDFTLTADVRYEDADGNEKESGGQLVGNVKVKRPGLALSTPSAHVCDDTVTVTLSPANAQTLTLYDNDRAVGPVHVGNNTVQLPGTDSELLTVHELYVMDGEGNRGDSLFIYHWALGPQLRKFTMDWDYIWDSGKTEHPCINVGDHYSHWSAIGMDNVRFTAQFENSDNLDDLPGWEDEDGNPVKVVFKVYTSDGVIRFLPARGSYGSYSATIKEHLARAVTHAEVLYQPVPGPTGVELEDPEYDVVWTADTETASKLAGWLADFREGAEAYLADKTAEDSYEVRWNGAAAELTGKDPTEPEAEKTMTEAFADAVAQFEGYGIDLASCGVAYHSERTTLEWLRDVAAQQLAEAAGRPGEYSRSVLYDGAEALALEKLDAARIAGAEHRQTRVSGSVTVDQFVLTDLDPDTLDEESCLYYVTLTFLADEDNGTYLSFCTANLGGDFTAFPDGVQSAAALMSGFEGHYGRYEDTKSSFGAAGGSSAILGTNASTIDLLNDTSSALQMTKNVTNYGGAALGVIDIWQGLDGWSKRTLDNHTMYRDIERFMSSPCFQKLTEGQKQLVQHNFEKFQKAYKKTETTDMIVTGTNTAITACGVAAACSGVAAPASLAITLGGVVVGWIGGAVNNAVRKEFVQTYEDTYNAISKIIRAHAYQANDDDCKGEDKPDGDGDSFGVCFDPSGVVYDGVIENPVEGATVTLYYAVDDGGNLLYQGEESLIAELRIARDVEGLDPASPVQVTGPDGLYQWFVPEGLWFVTVEYAGRIATSRLDAAATVNAAGLTLKGEAADRLLPVLPPQLDVNIPLPDAIAPTVEETDWTGEGLLVRFSKYMEEADVLSTGAYTVKNSAGETVAVTAVEIVERGHVPANTDAEEPTYTRAVLLKCALPADGALEVTASGTVRSYAGTAMGRAWTGFAASARAGSLGALGWSYRPETGVLSLNGTAPAANETVWAAVYDEYGRMTDLTPLAVGQNQLEPNAPALRLFWTDGQNRPKCASAVVR